MPVYTYIGNADPLEHTSLLVLRGGTLKIPIWTYADLTADEVASLSSRYTLVAGQYGNPAPAPTGDGSFTFRTAINFLVGGVIDGAVVLPDATIPVASGQTVKIVEVQARIENGTRVDVQLRRNGSAAGFALINNVTTAWTPMSPAPDITVANLDTIDFTLSDFAGDPENLSVSVILEHTT